VDSVKRPSRRLTVRRRSRAPTRPVAPRWAVIVVVQDVLEGHVARDQAHATIGGKGIRTTPVDLGRWRWVARGRPGSGHRGGLTPRAAINGNVPSDRRSK